MFINRTIGGYTRDGEQFARGRFLCVFHSNQFKRAEETGRDWREHPKELRRKLYATVRYCHLKQFGHWMMGTVSIGGSRVTVSGAYGGDGLPMDLEKLPETARSRLVEVPADLAEKFWNGGGHNSAGTEADAMRTWALETFGKGDK